MGDCPSKAKLIAYLQEVLSDRDREEVEDHVEACAACEALLERLGGLNASHPFIEEAAFEDTDANLLLALLALQNGFISREEIISATSIWLEDKSKSLARILRDSQFVSDDELSLLIALVQKHLEKHNYEVTESLATLSSIGSAAEDLRRLEDADVHRTLSFMGSGTPSDVSGSGVSIRLSTQPSDGCRFRIIRPHQKGGLGEVSVARDTELDREVALKEIQEQYADIPESRARFVQEAEITGKLEHPGIVPVYGLGTYDNGRPFYAMRFIKGRSLKEEIEHFHTAKYRNWSSGSGLLALRQLLGRFIDVCNAIDYAHSRGVLHRDLKPGNVMLGKYGETLVVDWGLAKPIAERTKIDPESSESVVQPSSGSGSTATQLGARIGTPAYMSPEQAAGRFEWLDPRTDVYSLGATLYHLLTGQAPLFGADSNASPESHDWESMKQHIIAGAFARPRKVNHRIHRALQDICLKAMAQRKVDRYSSPGELAKDVEAWMADQKVSAYRERLFEKLSRLARRHRTWARAGTFAVLVVAIAIGVAAMYALRAERRVSDQLKLQHRVAGYVREIDHARQQLMTGDIKAAKSILAELDHDLQGWEWDYLQEQCRRQYVELPEKMGTSRSASFLGSSERLAIGHRNGTVSVWEVTDGSYVTNLDGHTGNVVALAESGDGKSLVSCDDRGDVRVWNLSDGTERLTLKSPTGPDAVVAITRDGHHIAVATEATLKIWRDDGSRSKSFTSDVSVARSLAFSNDGQFIALAGDNATEETAGIAQVWMVEGDPTPVFESSQPNVRKVAFEADGLRMLIQHAEGVDIWNVPEGKKLCSIPISKAPLFDVVFRSSSELAGSVGEERLVWNTDTGELLDSARIVAPNGMVVCILSANGNWAVVEDEKGFCAISEINMPGFVAEYLERHRNFLSPCWSGDGRRLFYVVSTEDGRTIKVRNVGNGSVTNILREERTEQRPLFQRFDGSGAGRGLQLDQRDEKLKMFTTIGGTKMFASLETPTKADQAFRVGERHVALVTQNKVEIWRTSDNFKLSSLDAPVMLSKDGTRVVSTSLNSGANNDARYELEFWDSEKQQLKAFESRLNKVHGFSKNGDVFLSGDGGTIGLLSLDSLEFIQRLSGHTGHIKQLFSTGEHPWMTDERVVTAGTDNTVRLWEIKTGELLRTLSVPDETQISMTSDAAVLTTDQGSAELDLETGQVRSGKPDIWEASKFAEPQDEAVKEVDSQGPRDWHSLGLNLAVSYNGQRCIFWTRYDGPWQWDLSPGISFGDVNAPNAKIAPARMSRRVVTSLESQRVYSLHEKKLVTWDHDLKNQLASSSNSEQVRDMHLLNGNRLALSYDDRVELHDSADLKERPTAIDLATLPPIERGCVDSMEHGSKAVSRDGRWIAMVDTFLVERDKYYHDEAALTLWDVAQGNRKYPAIPLTHHISDMEFSGDGKRLLTTTGTSVLKGARYSEPSVAVQVWDVETGQITLSLAVGYAGGEMALTPGGSRLAARVGKPEKNTAVNGVDAIRIWQKATTDERFTLRPHGLPIRRLEVSKDGTRLLSVSSDGDDSAVVLWDLTDRRMLWRKLDRQDSVLVVSATFSPDGSSFAISRPHHGEIQVWDTIALKQISTFSPDHVGTRIAFSHDGERIINGQRWWPDNKSPIGVEWDWRTPKRIRNLEARPDSGIHVSSDGRFACSGRVWTFNSNESTPVEGATTNSEMIFSPDGRRVAVLEGGRLSVNDSDSGSRQFAVTVPAENTSFNDGQLAFTPDGKYIAVASRLGVDIRDSQTGERIRLIRGHFDDVNSVAFTPDGRTLISGADDRLIKAWDVSFLEASPPSVTESEGTE